MLTIKNISIEKKAIKKTPQLDKYVNLMKLHGISTDGYSLLPKNEWSVIKFELANSNVGFANGLRRTLVGEIPVQALEINDQDILTDDEFINGMTDVLVKNIGLLPIYQDCEFINADGTTNYDIYLFVYNNTSEIIDIRASDFSIVRKKTKNNVRKGGKAVDEAPVPDKNVAEKAPVPDKNVADKNVADEAVYVNTDNDSDEEDAKKSNVTHDTTHDSKHDTTHDSTPLTRDTSLTSKLFPETNITIMRLRPGKYLKLRSVKFVQGVASDDAGRFTLLNNIIYKPLDIEPYDQFTEKGTRSSTVDCKNFYFSLTTCGNIKPQSLIAKMTESIRHNLLDIRMKIDTYSKVPYVAYYNGDACEVTVVDQIYTYRFPGHYYTPVNMIAMQCYELDPNILYCISAVERYDTRIGIIRIKHAEPNKLLLEAINKCLTNLQLVESKF